ncbi:MAG: thiamine pyrophosphate-dependent enzyme [Bacillota bacterium]|nr:thiamine pyrophosphate-dependent enzyme [Bacillota bacterium]
MKQVFARPRALSPGATHYCPGCTYGIVHRLIAEALDDLAITGRAVGVASVGCTVLAYDYFECDFQQAAHGRAPAVATGIKRTRPDAVVFTLQGDGDLAAIGTAEIIHAAARGENITVFFLNNTIYGMTGGQMAPTTLLGQRSTTSQAGREPGRAGRPIRVSEMLATLDGPAYIERVAVDTPAHAAKVRRAIHRALELQLAGAGFTLVEVLSACPTNWGLTPGEALDRIGREVISYYPLGVYRDSSAASPAGADAPGGISQ